MIDSAQLSSEFRRDGQTLDGEIALPVPERIEARNFYQHFATHYPEEVGYFKEVGIDPFVDAPVKNPYTNDLATERFANIGEHCLAVGLCAARIAAVLVEKGALTEQEADHIVARALIHDLNKPFEIMRKNAQRAGIGGDVYSVAAYEKVLDLLAARGYSPSHVEYIRHAGSETGHNSLAQFLYADSQSVVGLKSGMLAEKIIHLADDMTYSSRPDERGQTDTKFLTCAERMEASRFAVTYPFLWSEGLALSGDGRIEPYRSESEVQSPSIKIGCYADLQKSVAHAICAELQRLIDPQAAGDAERFIRDLVNRPSPRECFNQ